MTNEQLQVTIEALTARIAELEAKLNAAPVYRFVTFYDVRRQAGGGQPWGFDVYRGDVFVWSADGYDTKETAEYHARRFIDRLDGKEGW